LLKRGAIKSLAKKMGPARRCRFVVLLSLFAQKLVQGVLDGRKSMQTGEGGDSGKKKGPYAAGPLGDACGGGEAR